MEIRIRCFSPLWSWVSFIARCPFPYKLLSQIAPIKDTFGRIFQTLFHFSSSCTNSIRELLNDYSNIIQKDRNIIQERLYQYHGCLLFRDMRAVGTCPSSPISLDVHIWWSNQEPSDINLKFEWRWEIPKIPEQLSSVMSLTHLAGGLVGWKGKVAPAGGRGLVPARQPRGLVESIPWEVWWIPCRERFRAIECAFQRGLLPPPPPSWGICAQRGFVPPAS